MSGYRVVPFEAWHVKALSLAEDAETGYAELLDPNVHSPLESTQAWSVLSSEGDVVACGGTIRQWKGRYVAWAYMTPQTGCCMLRLTRLVRDVLDEISGRVEITVRADFAAGRRWAELLGFEVENPPGVLRRYGPEGEDHISYVRVR